MLDSKGFCPPYKGEQGEAIPTYYAENEATKNVACYPAMNYLCPAGSCVWDRGMAWVLRMAAMVRYR